MADRAVSDVVSFVLVFSLIAATVGVVTVVGFAGLENARDAERVDNAVRAFDVLADNFEDIYRDSVPGRSTEIKLADARLSLESGTEINVSLPDVPGGTDSASVESIVYTAKDGSALVYETGAIIRVDDGGAVMLQEPKMLFSVDPDDGTRTVVVPIIQTRSADEDATAAGSTTVLVRGDLAVTEVLTSRSSTDNVTLRFTTTPARAPVWLRYFESELDDPAWESDCEIVGGETVECTLETDRIYVTATRIDVSLV
jgi:hypothetical protein